MRQAKLNHSPFAGIKKTERMLRQSSAESDITESTPISGVAGRNTESAAKNLARGDSAVKVAGRVSYAVKAAF